MTAAVRSISKSKVTNSALPNFLFLGPAGCGKSHIARYIASNAKATHIVVCGGDLQALGPSAGAYLRGLLEKCHDSGTFAAVVVIDEADGIVCSRKQVLQGQQVVVVNPCLYTILEATRNSSTHFSLILTTRLSVGDIDPALLDR